MVPPIEINIIIIAINFFSDKLIVKHKIAALAKALYILMRPKGFNVNFNVHITRHMNSDPSNLAYRGRIFSDFCSYIFEKL